VLGGEAEPVLVFRARTNSEYRADDLRNWMLQYFLNDRTIQIMGAERILWGTLPVPNEGRGSGDRARVRR